MCWKSTWRVNIDEKMIFLLENYRKIRWSIRLYWVRTWLRNMIISVSCLLRCSVMLILSPTLLLYLCPARRTDKISRCAFLPFVTNGDTNCKNPIWNIKSSLDAILENAKQIGARPAFQILFIPSRVEKKLTLGERARKDSPGRLSI